MKRKTIFHLLLLLPMLVSFCFAQSKIQGKISDAKDQQKLSNATVMLLSAKDSILLDFTRSDENGNFSLSTPVQSEAVLIVSYPKYGDYYTEILPNQDYSALKVGLTNTAQLLQEVIVTGRIPITIKGDTTEYDAGSFKVEKNAKVEDLLKVLPGITVDASGKITAQGKTVKKVLVDGEEFFGDDPKLVTRNIRSDMVDKVQVYEKQSEQAERTGVDDGNKEQTINVKLKEGSKNGIFGKAVAGVGTDDYYNGQLMLNKFKGSQKISAYGLFGNNGGTSLSWEDAQKYGSDSGVSYNDDGMYFSSGGDDFSGSGSIGVPKVMNTGVNFFDKWKTDKHKLNLSYKYGKIESDGNERTNKQNNLENDIQFTDKVRNAKSDLTKQRMNLKYDLKFDSLTTLTIQGNASKSKNWTDDRSLSNTINKDGILLNSDSTNNSRNSNAQSFGLNAFLTKKFKKAGRSVSLNMNINRDENDGDGYLFANIQFYKDNVASKDTTDQYKKNDGNNTTKGATITYTEPLTKKLNLSLNYGLNKNDNNSSQFSYNRDQAGNYNVLDDRFSNDYSYDRFSNNYKVALTYKDEKLRANFTNSINDDQLKQSNNRSKEQVQRSFLTYNPNLNISYNITKGKGIYFSYSGRNQLPSLNQIQPILDNTDQLNLVIGNENLKPSFSNSFNVNYNSFKILSGSYTYLGANYSNQNDAFVQNITTDEESGKSIYRWENLTDKTNQSINVYGGFHFKLNKELGIENSPRIAVYGSKNYNMINGALNKVDVLNYSFTYAIFRNMKKGFDFDINLTPGFKTMNSSLQPDVNSNGFTFGSNGGATYFFPKKFKVYVNYDYTYEASTKAFATKFDQLLIHPGVSKKFLKNESLELDFTVNDILNQNKGFARSQNNSVFTQRRYDTIQRYYMLKLSWDFTKMFMN
ncbi:outer membrane beta-barrel protein [Sphingobacterium kitahiroshimense]|uniref:Outer membrane beta-barrel protein n=1 Tax=Sphingobacterium kitahiroshimense TaxID=470446 RepID=A0ABV0BTL4_9SPHI